MNNLAFLPIAIIIAVFLGLFATACANAIVDMVQANPDAYLGLGKFFSDLVELLPSLR